MRVLMRLVPFVVFLFTALWPSLYAYADDTVVGRTPEGVYPMNEPDVEMESEDILVNLEKNTVECLFLFHNTGEAKRIRMGFPGKLEAGAGTEFSDDVSLSLRDFKTEVMGKDIPVTYEKGVRSDTGLPVYSEWYTFTVPFQKGEKVAVKNSYRFTPTYDSIGDVFTGYVLQTGATWKGPIGKAKVTFVLGSIKPWQVERLNPGGFRFEGDKIVWEREQFEPTYDLGVFYNTWHYSDEFLKSSQGEETKAIQERIDKYLELGQMAKRKDSAKLYNEYVNAMEKGDRMLAVYASSLITEEPMQDSSITLGDIFVTRIPNSDASQLDCKIRSMYTPNVVTQVTHKENGETVIDLENRGISPEMYFALLPGIEYNISVTATDWLDRTVKKEVRYKVPDTASTMEPDTTSSTKPDTSPATESDITSATKPDTSSTMESDTSATSMPAPTSPQTTVSSGKAGNAQEETIPYWPAISVIALICVATGAVIIRRLRIHRV